MSMSSCKVAAISNSPVFSPSSSSSISSPKTPPSSSSSSPRLFRLHMPSGLAISLSSSNASSPEPSLKRKKRPPRLLIPAAFFEDKTAAAVAEEKEEEVAVEGDGYAVCCKKGKRRDLIEDRYSAVVGIHGDSNKALFGIYDGHGGPKAAEFASQNLDKNIIEELEKQDNNSRKEIEQAIKCGYLTTDSQFLNTDHRGGTCCVTALISKGNVVVSNSGDCRAVSSRRGIAEALSHDHRPSREDERSRIEDLGGFVECRNGVWRVLGSLAVSRSIGDQYLKQWVIAEPETNVFKLGRDYEFLLLASDGLWDKVSNQEAVDVARRLCINVDKPQPLLACKKLIDLSALRGSTDDISVMFIQVQRFC